jgi:hypothetical protein
MNDTTPHAIVEDKPLSNEADPKAQAPETQPVEQRQITKLAVRTRIRSGRAC